jgi:hypothetical protein
MQEPRQSSLARIVLLIRLREQLQFLLMTAQLIWASILAKCRSLSRIIIMLYRLPTSRVLDHLDKRLVGRTIISRLLWLI